MRGLTHLILIIIALAAAATAPARTWRVEKDGSGDATVIQTAIDLAASGDTIQIGPGTFSDFAWAWYNGEWNVYSCAQATQDELTIIGAGIGETIIGGIPPEDYGDTDINGISMINDGVLHLRDLEIVGLVNGVHFEGSVLDIDHCEIDGNSNTGVVTWARGGNAIKNSVFRDNHDVGMYFASTSDNGIVRSCEFYDNDEAIYISHCPHTFIQDCVIHGGRNHVGVFEGAHVELRDCQFCERGATSAVYISSSDVRMYNCRIAAGVDGLYFEQWGSLIGSGNVLEGCSRVTFHVGADATRSFMDFHGNDILNGRGYSVINVASDDNCPSEPCHVDLSGNYWGTDDPDLIATWIYDYYDFHPPHWDHQSIIDFEPFSPVSVPVTPTSWGALKSLFRR